METKVLRFLRSQAFLIAIMVLFAVESVWIAISAAYPMAFDENMHFGIIQLYADRLNPLFLQQPDNANFAGALVHNPSYLYHYLMSFPYRLIASVTDSQMAQIVFLRLINVALFGIGLLLFRRLLLKTKVSPAIVNLTLLFFILIPVVPLLAGQINYDNLIMPLAGLALLMAISVDTKLRVKQLPVKDILLLAAVCMLSSLVKFEFLPIFAAIFLWLGWQIWRSNRRGDIKLTSGIQKGWKSTSWQQKSLVGLPLVLATGLFIQIYGVNLVTFHTLWPKCDQVLTREQCAAYAPWQRDQEAFAVKQSVNGNPLVFAGSWTYRMFVMMFYTSSGGANQNTAWYLSINPLPIIFLTALMVFALGVVLIGLYHRKLFKDYEFFGFMVFVTLFYLACLFARNYYDFLAVGQKIAINGRYLFPIALPAMLVFVMAYRQFFGERQHLKTAFAIATLVLFLQGGGALSYITASNDNWHWQNKVVRKLNNEARGIVRPLMFSKTPIEPVSLGSD